MFCGIALMIFPYFVGDTWLVYAIGVIGTVALFFLRYDARIDISYARRNMADEPAKIILGDTAITGIEQPGKRRFFRRKIDDRPPLIALREAAVTLLTARWCSQCGQAAIDYRRSFATCACRWLDLSAPNADKPP